METVFISMSRTEFEAVVIECVNACLKHNQPPEVNLEACSPLDTQEAAAFVKIEIPTLYTLVQKKKIPFHRKGKRLYFFKDELVDWIKQSAPDATAAAEVAFVKANSRKKRGNR